MSNYPPGVSGFEPQIAGYPEREVSVEVECSADAECDFKGTVDATEINYGSEIEVVWECPNCGGENADTREVEDGPDPDDERDRMIEDSF